MLTPFSQRHAPSDEWIWAADNGCFSSRWDKEIWLRWLKSFDKPHTALFATVPDIVADHEKTLERWREYAPIVKGLGYKAAFVLQDGATIDTIPWTETDYLFIGGTTEFKLSEQARQICFEAQLRDIQIHMGRVNSKKRLLLAKSWGVDTADGTYIAFGPDVNTPKLVNMINTVNKTSVDVALPYI